MIGEALDLLVEARPPSPVVQHFDEPWPGNFDEWKKAWHPLEPSPMIRWFREQALQNRAQREGGG